MVTTSVDFSYDIFPGPAQPSKGPDGRSVRQPGDTGHGAAAGVGAAQASDGEFVSRADWRLDDTSVSSYFFHI